MTLKRVEFIENGKSVLFLGDYITKFKDKITLTGKDAYVDNMLAMLAWRAADQKAHPWCERSLRKRRARDAGRLRGRNVSVSCGHLDVFQETPFRLALRSKVSGNGEFLADQGSHETFETSFALHARHARHASGIGVMDRGQTSTKNGGRLLVVC